MKTLQIQDGMVFICGPSTTGKTTLARRIFQEAPYRDKIIISHDDVLLEFINEHKLPKEQFVQGLSPTDDEQFRTKLMDIVKTALESRKFVVYEGCYCDTVTPTGLITMLPLIGLDRPLTLLKMWPSTELHHQLIHGRFKDCIVDVQRIKHQRVIFESVIEPRYYAKFEYVHEYTIEDPRDITLNFKKRGELSKELLAAYETWSTIH